MNKAEKIQILKRAFERQGLQRVEGETDAQYVGRTVQERLALMKDNFLKNQITNQLRIEAPEVIVSDL